VEQESLANAKVSAQCSACMKAPSEEIYDKSTQGTLKSTFGGLQRCRRFYVHSFSCCCLQNQRNPGDSLKTLNW